MVRNKFIVIHWLQLPSQNKKNGSCQDDTTLKQVQKKHTHTHPFNGPLSGTTQVSRYQKGKTNLDFTEWQWVAVESAGPYASLHLAPDR